MTRHVPVARQRWQATFIITLFILAVAGAAFTGWRFARESPPHQGPIILVTADGLRAEQASTPNISALAARGIVFEHAYAHSPQTLPAHAALISGQLPFDNGIRDDGGFALKEQTRTIAAALRNRGFNTGAAVSSFLLRRATGLAQGFSFYDTDIPDEPPDVGADLQGGPYQRDGVATFEVAQRWMQSQSGQRYFLFLQIDAASADAVVGRLLEELRRTRRYNDSTIIFTAAHGDAPSGAALTDASLHVPFIVKLPGEAGAGRHVPLPVQHIDLLPTLLDVVRAPMPSGLRGRSLRAILDKTSGFVPDQPIYAEFVAPRLRFDGQPLFALSSGSYRLVRGFEDDLQRLSPDAPAVDNDRIELLNASLDKFVAARPIDPPALPAEADVDRLAAFGYLQGLRVAVGPAAPVAHPSVAPFAPRSPLSPLTAAEQAALWKAHQQAASLLAQKRFAAALDALSAMAMKHAELSSVQYQRALLLARTGRLDEAVKSFQGVAAAQPDDPEIPIALASTLLRARRLDDATMEAEQAVMLADAGSSAGMKAAAHEIAARVALARDDAAAATLEATAAQKADAHLPLPQFVTGRIAYDDGRYDDALAAFKDAAMTVDMAGTTLAELHLSLGNTYARLDRYTEAEAEFREELREYPHNIATYASLAMLYRASNRESSVEQVIGDLVEAAPTPEGYSMAARLWTIVGERARAEALRLDARRRFRGDPSVALLGRPR